MRSWLFFPQFLYSNMLEAEECLSHDALNASSSGISPQLEDSELFDVANLRRWLEKSSLSPDAVIF